MDTDIIQARMDKLVRIIGEEPERLDQAETTHHSLVSPLTSLIAREFAENPEVRVVCGFNYAIAYVRENEVARTSLPISIKKKLDELDEPFDL